MEISCLGHSSFKIIGKDITIIADPFNPEKVGLPFPRTECNVVTVSHDHFDHNNTSIIKGNHICFDSPGEYEIKGAEIRGIKSFHDDKGGSERGLNTIFVYEIDGIKICHLGDLGHQLSSEQLEEVDGVDILIIPVGGHYTIDYKGASKVISDIDPKIVIPMHYKDGKMNELAPVDDFLKEIGKEPKKTDKLKLQKKDLPEEMELYILSH